MIIVFIQLGVLLLLFFYALDNYKILGNYKISNTELIESVKRYSRNAQMEAINAEKMAVEALMAQKALEDCKTGK